MDYERIPPGIIESLDAYIQHGRPTGGFLEAVIRNDLREAVGKADDTNRECLFEIVAWMVTKAPLRCWGYSGAYKDWLFFHKQQRKGSGGDALGAG